MKKIELDFDGTPLDNDPKKIECECCSKILDAKTVRWVEYDVPYCERCFKSAMIEMGNY